MKLSLCMIVKNEQEVLARCLDCAVKFADEIIIVDTGSTDQTKSIAHKYTDKVYNFEWCDDFSKARNYSFSKAGGDYIIWLDADDIVTTENISKINQLKSKMQADIYMCTYNCGQGKNAMTFYRERILKNDGSHFWQGFIHEAIGLKGKVEYTDIAITHGHKSTPRPRRNINIFRKHIRAGEVLDARLRYYYVKELYYNAYYKKCIHELKRLIDSQQGSRPNIYDAYLTLGRCYRYLGEHKKAYKVWADMLAIYKPSAELLCEMANELVTLGNDFSAIELYERALYLDHDEAEFRRVEFKDYVPLMQLVMLYYKIGDMAKAKEYHVRTKKLLPTDPAVQYNEQFFV